MTLFVHRGRSTAALADGLADLLGEPLADPFATEVVAVPAKGVERWLAQRLSHRLGAGATGDDGVCAGVRFLNPHSLVALVLGIERDDPWHPEQLAWPVLRAVDACLDEPWARSLAAHLGHGVDGIEGDLRRGRRMALARRLAGLFADYAAARPALLADWRQDGSGDGLGGEVAADLAWQPELWRRVLAEVGGEAPDERQARVVEALGEGGDAVAELELPGRLSLFGHTRIARSEIEVLRALAGHRDVHLWLPQASPTAWNALRDDASRGPIVRADDESGLLVNHPLLASLGRDARELQRTLALAGAVEDEVDGEVQVEVDPHSAPHRHRMPTAPMLLSHLQSDLAADHLPDATTRASRGIPAADRSIQVHACHGASRQVDVLRDVLADLLEADPTLEPRDVLVLCPDIDAFAPLLHAGFGLGEVVDESAAHPAHRLRVRLADRAPLHTNPLLHLATRLVELAGGRLTASEVLDVVRLPVVRRRFGLTEDSLERIGDWVAASVIRWGLDAEHRGAYQLAGLTQNSWSAGLDRVLVGGALDGDDVDHLGTTLTLDDLDSGDLDLAGSLAELVDRLGATIRALTSARTVPEWVTALGEGVHGLADVPFADRWQQTQLDRELARIEAAATAPNAPTTLALSDIRALLTERTAGRATRSSFRTGTLTVCTMVPMRSVPHRVVALVGLDDGAFPRTTHPDGDDALARTAVTGERDPRSEDRQLLLDALMSAGDHLVITYAGFDEHTGHERPPSVPLGEFVDAVRRTASGEGVDRVVTAHPLQPFDARNLGATPATTRSLLPADRPFSHDPAALAGAVEALDVREDRPRLGALRLPPVPAADVDLEDLLRFFDNPAKAFLRSRLGLSLPVVPGIKGEGIPIELDGLETWGIADRVLGAVLDGRDPVAIKDAELWRGQLPPAAMGARSLDELLRNVRPIVDRVWQIAERPRSGRLDREAVDIDVVLRGGRRLTGTIGGLVGDRALAWTYSHLSAKHRIRSWIVSLALAAAGRTNADSATIGRRTLAIAGPHPQTRALEILEELVDLRDRGLREVVPLPPKTSLAWWGAWRQGASTEERAEEAAVKEWAGTKFGGERDDTAWAHVLGPAADLSALTGPRAADEEWAPEVASRLGQYACRLWAPIRAEGREVLR